MLFLTQEKNAQKKSLKEEDYKKNAILRSENHLFNSASNILWYMYLGSMTWKYFYLINVEGVVHPCLCLSFAIKCIQNCQP